MHHVPIKDTEPSIKILGPSNKTITAIEVPICCMHVMGCLVLNLHQKQQNIKGKNITFMPFGRTT